jgi:PIN domain nuclease of toxin-antitoxin system
MVVLDTSALIYWTLDPNQLSKPAENGLQRSERILISSISVWEIGLKVKHQKLVIPLTIGGYVEKLRQVEGLEILPVDVQTWLDNLNLPWDHRDPADRTIVVLATRYNCPLITSDRVIADFYPQTIW